MAEESLETDESPVELFLLIALSKRKIWLFHLKLFLNCYDYYWSRQYNATGLPVSYSDYTDIFTTPNNGLQVTYCLQFIVFFFKPVWTRFSPNLDHNLLAQPLCLYMCIVVPG